MMEADGNRMSFWIIPKGIVEDAAPLTENCSILQKELANVDIVLYFH